MHLLDEGVIMYLSVYVSSKYIYENFYFVSLLPIRSLALAVKFAFGPSKHQSRS